MNLYEYEWLGIVPHPKYCSEAQTVATIAARTLSNQVNHRAE